MKEVRLNSFVIMALIPIFFMLANIMPESWVDGPFNHKIDGDFFSDSNLVPNTFYLNNNTDYYTIWDDDSRKYVTYNKSSNVELETVVFNAPEMNNSQTSRVRLINGWNNVVKRENGSRIKIVGNKVVPTSHLDEEGMLIQEKQGCLGCHES